MTALGAILAALVFVLVVGGAARYGFLRRRRTRMDAEVLAAGKTAAEEDVGLLGAEVAQLELDIRGTELDPNAQRDYAWALKSYDTARAALAAASSPRGLRDVTVAVEEGRYAAACVRAGLAGRPVPERRAPCFFNPQHGPSAQDMEWAAPGGTVRQVPVCAADAERLTHGESPDTREVLVNGVRRPYWEVGEVYAPLARGYYGGYGMNTAFTDTSIGSSAGGGLDGGYLGGGGDCGGGGGDSGGGL